MKKDGNAYIFIYASVLVVASAVILSLAATLLKPAQIANIQTEKRLSILHSIGLDAGVESALDKTQFVQDRFDRYIVEELVVSPNGEPISGCAAFDLDLRGELACSRDQRRLPVFVARLDDDSRCYIFPLSGAGLWGPIWGYIALEEDLSTVYGVSFEHAGETPGLGAEIVLPAFTDQFAGKQIMKDGKLASIQVVKNRDTREDPYAVDGISGGTMTSNGVQAMLADALAEYEAFIRIRLSEREAGSSMELGGGDLDSVSENEGEQVVGEGDGVLKAGGVASPASGAAGNASTVTASKKAISAAAASEKPTASQSPSGPESPSVPASPAPIEELEVAAAQPADPAAAVEPTDPS